MAAAAAAAAAARPQRVEAFDVGAPVIDSIDLQQKTTSGVGWVGLSRVAIQLIQFGSTVVLARLLLPSQFGLAAIVTALVAFANLFTDLGLGASLIHRQDELDERFRATAFWLNTLTGFVLTGVVSACAIPLAALFGHRALVPLILVGSLVFSVSMYAVHLAVLERAMRYKVVGTIEFIAAVVSVAVSIIAAVLGAGPMSIVLGSLAQAVLTTIMMWSVVRWRPQHWLDRASLHEIWRYSGSVFGSNVIAYWARNADDLLIARFGTAADLGFYSRAYMLMLMPVQQVVMVISRVLFPALSRLQHDYARLRAGYLRAVSLMIAVGAPMSLGLAAAAGPFIDVAYGTRWHPAARLVTLLAISGPAQLVATTSSALYQAIGQTKAQFRRALFNAAITIGGIAIGVHWGALGVAISLLITYNILLPITVRRCWQHIGLGLGGGLRAIAAPVCSAALMALGMAAVGHVLSSTTPLVRLVVEVLVGLPLYVVLLWLTGRRLLGDLLDVVLRGRRAVGAHAGARAN